MNNNKNFLRFLQVALITFSMVTICNGIILDCEYSFKDNWNIANIYTCTARIISVGDYRNVSDVTFNHLDDLTNADVKGLIFENQILDFAPFNIHSFFPNLESFDLSSGLVDELTSDHLTGLKELQQFRFENNTLRIIESNLFNENPLLTWISFDGNPVRHVGHNVFDELELLHSLSLSGNDDACTNQTASNSRTDVDLLLFQLIVKCPPTFEMTENKIVNGLPLQEKIDQQIALKVDLDPITATLLQIEENLRELELRVEELEGSESNEINK